MMTQLPPVEVQRRLLIFEDSDDDLAAKMFPMRPMKERVSDHAEKTKKKDKKLVKLGSGSSVGVISKKSSTSIMAPSCSRGMLDLSLQLAQLPRPKVRPVLGKEKGTELELRIKPLLWIVPLKLYLLRW
ncbi:unnamed protein product [Linum trigynum]|uniref:Uncharacterized protein n=1 Tax=Linum trigynum TaxID=586398 RepID=A0AAV2CUR4_9ROSI